MLAKREAAVQRPFIQVARGLLEPKHVETIGPAVWVFLWCLRYQSTNDGSVLARAVIPISRFRFDLGLSERTVREHLDRLENGGYLTLETVEGKGLRIFVNRPTAMQGTRVAPPVHNGAQLTMPLAPPEAPRRISALHPGGNPPGLDAPTILGSKAVKPKESQQRADKPRTTPSNWDQRVTIACAPVIAKYKTRLLGNPDVAGPMSTALATARKAHKGARPEAFATALAGFLKATFPGPGVVTRGMNPYGYLDRAVSGANEDAALSEAHHLKKGG